MDSDDIIDELKHEPHTWQLLMELQQMQINLNGGRIMQVKSRSGLVVVEPFFCSNPHLLQPSEFFPS